MGEPYLSEILILAFNFAPTGYTFCNGQTMPINQNAALFSLLGTTFGGNGTTTFQLPNLQGQTLVHFGAPPGSGTAILLGQAGGEVAVTLTNPQMPAHAHALMARPQAANTEDPTGSYLANQRSNAYARTATQELGAGVATTLSPAGMGTAGGSQAHENQPPFLVVNMSIALVGIFPSRS